jgi:hypothetical protein
VVVPPPWEGGDGNAIKGFDKPRIPKVEKASSA